MSTTIDSLNIQIEASAGQATAKINALATALGNLKSNSKITTAVNGLNKLASALNTLNPALGNLNVAKLNSLRGTLIGLGNISKLSGLNSALNTLKKLPEIINDLDDAALTQFTTSMNRLSKALEPLVTKINQVGAAFAALPAHLRQAVTAVNNLGGAVDDLGSDLDAGGLNLMTFTSNLETLWSYAQRVIQVMANAIAVAIEWDGIQYRFGRAFGEDAEEVYAHVQRINEVMGISIQEFMQYSSLYGSLLSGFGMAQDKVTTISVGLTELSYDIWAAYNDRFKSLEEASEAVRSAITGEIEPIRNAGIALTEASLQEYLDQIGMAEVSIEKLSEAQKAEVRYAAMVNAAMNQGIVGTYAAEMQTAEGAVRNLSQSMKTLKQAFGGLFIPILQAVIPYLAAFVQLLTEAVHWIAALFGIELFKIDWGSSAGGVSDLADGIGGVAAGAGAATDGLEDAAGAAKKLKDYTMGFDELNVIEPPKETGGAGGAGGGVGGDGWGEGLMDLDTLWDDAIFEKASQQVNELKEKMRDFFTDWKTWAVAAGVAMAALALSWDKIKAAYAASKLASAVTAVSNFARALWGAAKGGAAAQSAFAIMYPKLTAVAGWFRTAWTAASAFIGGLSTGAILTIVGIIAAIASVVYFLYENWDKVTLAVKAFFAENIQPKLESMKESWEKIKGAVAGVRDAILNAIPPEVKAKLEDLSEWIGNVVKKTKEWFKSVDWLEAIGKVFETIGGVIFGVVSGVIAGAINTFVGMLENLVEIFAGVAQYIGGWVELIVSLFSGDLDGARKACKKIIDGIVTLWKGLWGLIVNPIKSFYQGVIDWFTKLWDELVGHSIVPDMIDAIVDWFLSLPKKILSPIQNFVNDVIKKFKDMWSSVKSWYNQNVAPKFTKEYWKNTFDSIVTGLKAKLDEAWTKVKDFFDVNEWKNKVVAAMGAIKDNFKIPELPKFKLSVTWDTDVGPVKKTLYKALGLSGWPDLSWSTYAAGGFPGMGEMFIAREAGPELVGRIGSRSAVANNDQIVSAVSQGVYSAVRAAMSGEGGNGQNVNVYLDGKQIYSSVKKTERERGLSLMGSQLGYAY